MFSALQACFPPCLLCSMGVFMDLGPNLPLLFVPDIFIINILCILVSDAESWGACIAGSSHMHWYCVTHYYKMCKTTQSSARQFRTLVRPIRNLRADRLLPISWTCFLLNEPFVHEFFTSLYNEGLLNLILGQDEDGKKLLSDADICCFLLTCCHSSLGKQQKSDCP